MQKVKTLNIYAITKWNTPITGSRFTCYLLTKCKTTLKTVINAQCRKSYIFSKMLSTADAVSSELTPLTVVDK